MTKNAQQQQHSIHLDPLLDCLVIITKMHNHPYSPEALKAGLPLVNNRLTPELFHRAAERAHLSSRIVKRSLKDISPLVLPAVLLLYNNNACVLETISDEGICSVVFPESGIGKKEISIDELDEQYSQYAIFLQSQYKFEERADEYHIHQPKSWFWGTIWQYRSTYYQVLLAAVLVNLFALASPLFIMNVYDRVIPNYAVETLWVLASGIAIIFIFDFILKTLRSYLIDTSGKKADTVLGTLIFQRVLGMRLGHKPNSSGAFANNLREFDTLRDLFTSASLVSIIDLPFVFLFLGIIAYVGGYIALIPALAIPVTVAISYFLELPIRSAIKESFLGNTQKHALLVESLSGLEIIKSLSAEGLIQRRYEDAITATEKAGLKSRFFSSLSVNLTVLTQQAVTVLVVIAGVYAITNGNLTTGGLIATVILTGRTLAPLTNIVNTFTKFQRAKYALQSLNQLMDTPQERNEQSRFLHRPKLHGDIIFRGVDFHYPQQPNKALENVSFHIRASEKVAIIGPIGAGKSSVIRLIMGLHHPDAGAIEIDGTDITQMDPADLRRNIAYVPQDTTLFYGTVRDNIAMGMPWADDRLILHVARLAGVENFVKHHPLGYDMPVRERGENLSGGQRQAIALARALLINPSILLFDEPTSALDNKNKLQMLQMLKKFSGGKTTLIITHDPSVLHLVDRTIIIDSGHIKYDGPTNEILGGTYGGERQQQTQQKNKDVQKPQVRLKDDNERRPKQARRSTQQVKQGQSRGAARQGKRSEAGSATRQGTCPQAEPRTSSAERPESGQETSDGTRQGSGKGKGQGTESESETGQGAGDRQESSTGGKTS